MDIKFGRKIPTDWSHVEKYPFMALGLNTVTKVEKTLSLPSYRTYYDQGNMGACVGFSSSWMMSIYNRNEYDAVWLYHEAQLTDDDPETNPDADNGTYVNAAFDVLRKEGHVRVYRGKDKPLDKNDGIKSYYWCKSVDEIRTALSLGRPVVLGINWYEEFFSPVKKSSNYFIGSSSNWGDIAGGHAICCYGASDKKQAFKLVNSWGMGYPLVWLPYAAVTRLLKEDGEACAAIDNPLKS